MKSKIMAIISIGLMISIMSGCGSSTEEISDIDLTQLSSTMVYSEVYNMMVTPEEYVGKIIKAKGVFVAFSSEDGSQYYPAVLVADATACCSQGIEFLLEGNPNYPDGYPELEEEIIVEGRFETYEEDGIIYCRLQNAKLY